MLVKGVAYFLDEEYFSETDVAFYGVYDTETDEPWEWIAAFKDKVDAEAFAELKKA